MVATLDEAYVLPATNYLMEMESETEPSSFSDKNFLQNSEREGFKNIRKQCSQSECNALISKILAMKKSCPDCFKEITRIVSTEGFENTAWLLEKKTGANQGSPYSIDTQVIPGRVRSGFADVNMASVSDRDIVLRDKTFVQTENTPNQKRELAPGINYSTYSYSNSSYNLVESFTNMANNFVKKSTKSPQEMFKLIVLGIFIYMIIDLVRSKKN
jgi:hypothetical protein